MHDPHLPYNQPAADSPAGDARHLAVRRMELCTDCDSRLVHPLEWDETENGFGMWLRCPECLNETYGEFSNLEVTRYELVLDEDRDVMVGLLLLSISERLDDWVEASAQLCITGAWPSPRASFPAARARTLNARRSKSADV
jgi:hypothetical protein